MLDKTGTITEGQPRVTDCIPAQGAASDELLQTALALEAKSEHPLARAVVAYAKEKGLEAEPVEAFAAMPGNGLCAKRNEEMLYGGNERYIRRYAVIPPEMSARAAKLASEGKTPLYFASEERFYGCLAVADVVRESSRQAVQELKNMGISTVMLTGDNERTAQAIARKVGVERAVADVLPAGKEEEVRRLAQKGKVAMVGDGINDAPALTRADVGIAIGAGTDVAVDAADVVLMKSDLLDVCAAIRLSRAVIRNIHENLFWAFFYNIVCIPLAAGVWYPAFGLKLNPMVGAAAMSLSSFCVVMNALRLNLVRVRDSSREHRKYKKAGRKEKKEMTKTIKIEGMMCPHCEAAMRRALEEMEGVSVISVSHDANQAVVSCTVEVPEEEFRKVVEKAGYEFRGIE